MTSELYLWCRVRRVRQCGVTVFFGRSGDSESFVHWSFVGPLGVCVLGHVLSGFRVMVDCFEGNRHVIASEAICAVVLFT
jgi:hypothetical protein